MFNSDAALTELQQLGVTGWGTAGVEMFTKGGVAGAPGDVVVDQGQQARLLHRTPQHELNICGADIAWCGWLGEFYPIAAAQVGGQVQEKAAALVACFSLGQKVLHQGQAALLQLLLALNIPR